LIADPLARCPDETAACFDGPADVDPADPADPQPAVTAARQARAEIPNFRLNDIMIVSASVGRVNLGAFVTCGSVCGRPSIVASAPPKV
jgi:hypothetical protein